MQGCFNRWKWSENYNLNGRKPNLEKKKFLPYSRQVIDEEDIESVTRVLRSAWLTTGPMVKEFEEKFAEEVNADYAIACSSGTGALHLLYVAQEGKVQY